MAMLPPLGLDSLPLYKYISHSSMYLFHISLTLQANDHQAVNIYIYIYIYIERERESTHIHTFINKLIYTSFFPGPSCPKTTQPRPELSLGPSRPNIVDYDMHFILFSSSSKKLVQYYPDNPELSTKLLVVLNQKHYQSQSVIG